MARAVSAAIALLVLVPAASAGAGSAERAAPSRAVALKGRVAGDSDGTVSMRIVIRRGVPRRVVGFVARKVDHACTDGVIREYTIKFSAGMRIRPLLRGKYVFFASNTVASPAPLTPGYQFVSGDTRRSARRVTGGTLSHTIRFPSNQPSGETSCTAGPNFTASR
jgi:hypothetical protein